MSDQVTITVDIPRTLDAYAATTHFMERLKYRTDPSPSEEIVETVLERGTIKTTQQSERRIFEAEVGLTTWWVIVRINEAAFVSENEHHQLLTVYCPDKHGDHKTVFETERGLV